MKNIITVSRPVLSETERERRMKEIKEAAIRLILAADVKRKKNT